LQDSGGFEPLDTIRICWLTETEDTKNSFIETEKVFPSGEWVLVTVIHDVDGAKLFWNDEIVAQGPVPLASEVERQMTIVGHNDWLKHGYESGVRYYACFCSLHEA
jgi:hypothetical protein